MSTNDPPLTHTPCVPLDPPGDGRRWKCLGCGRIGSSIADLNAEPCPSPIGGAAGLRMVAGDGTSNTDTDTD